MARWTSAIVPFAFGAVFLSVTGLVVRHTSSFLAISHKTTGLVEDSSGKFPEFSFQTPEGRKHTFRGNFASFLSPRKGQSVEVLYDPANPSNASQGGFLGYFALWIPALFFGGIGIICIGVGIQGLSRTSGQQRAAPAREAGWKTGEPWSSRPDWAQGRIESSTRLAWQWGLAIFLNLASWGVTILIWLAITGGGQRPLRTLRLADAGPLILPFIFVVIAVAYLVKTVTRTYQATRSGRSLFVMSSVPGVIGGSLEGVIHGRLRLRDDQGVRLILRSSVCSTRQSGSRVRISTKVNWEDDRAIPATGVTQAGDEAAIPVRIAIPATCRETAEKVEPPQGQLGDLVVSPRPGDHDSVSWTLEARAEPGHAWRAEFEVPVFRTAASAPARGARAGVGTGADGLPAELRARGVAAMRSMSLGEMARVGEELQEREVAVAGPTPRPFDTRVVVHPATTEGVLIEYPAAFLFVAFAAWWLLTLPLYVVLPLDLLRLHLLGPAASLAVAAALNGLPGYLMVYHWSRRLLIGPETITVFCGLPLFGARRRLPTAEAEKVHVNPENPGNLAIVRKGKTGLFDRFFFVAPPLASHAEARWLAAEIERALAAYR